MLHSHFLAQPRGRPSSPRDKEAASAEISAVDEASFLAKSIAPVVVAPLISRAGIETLVDFQVIFPSFFSNKTILFVRRKHW